MPETNETETTVVATEPVAAPPEMVKEIDTLRSQLNFAAKRNAALKADLGKRLVNVQTELTSIAADLEKILLTEA